MRSFLVPWIAGSVLYVIDLVGIYDFGKRLEVVGTSGRKAFSLIVLRARCLSSLGNVGLLRRASRDPFWRLALYNGS